MLVLSREAGGSIVIESADETSVVTVLKVVTERWAVSILVNRASSEDPGRLDTRTVEIPSGGSIRVGGQSKLTVVDIRDEKVRIGINSPSDSSIHRLEVYEEIRRENRKDDDDSNEDDRGIGSPSPRPSSPKPPSLDVRLVEPTDEDDEK